MSIRMAAYAALKVLVVALVIIEGLWAWTMFCLFQVN